MPHIILYPPNKGQESKSVVQEKIKNLVDNTAIKIIEFQGLTTYQQERAFIYGDRDYGHAIAVICISEEEPIPFGVLSADINNKKLPIIIYVENNDKAKKIYTEYCEFLFDTNTQIGKHFNTIDSFHFIAAS